MVGRLIDCIIQLPVGTSRYHNETNNQQPSQSQTEDSDTEGTTTETESNASSSVNAMAWQDDPEFQDKIRYDEMSEKIEVVVLLHTFVSYQGCTGKIQYLLKFCDVFFFFFRKLKSAKKKLKQLQELVKRVHQVNNHLCCNY